MFMRFLGICLAVFFLSGCNTLVPNVLSYEAPDPVTGRFPEIQTVKPNEILVDKKIDLRKYKKLLVVAVKEGATLDVKNEEQYWSRSLQSLGYFNDVVTTDNLSQFLIETTHNPRIPKDITDIQSLREAENIYGKFLVVEVSTHSDRISKIAFEMTVKDPATGRVYFMIKREQLDVFTWNQTYSPALNAFRDWIQKNS